MLLARAAFSMPPTGRENRADSARFATGYTGAASGGPHGSEKESRHVGKLNSELGEARLWPSGCLQVVLMLMTSPTLQSRSRCGVACLYWLDATGTAGHPCDCRPARSRRLRGRRVRDLHVRRRYVSGGHVHALECGAGGGRAAVSGPWRRLPAGPGYLRGRRGRGLDDELAGEPPARYGPSPQS